MIADIEGGRETKVDLKDAITYAARAWKDVSAACIQNCFRKAGCTFPSSSDVSEVTQSGPEPETITDESGNSARNIWDFVATHLSLPAEKTFENYVECDTELPTDESALTEDEIVSYVLQPEESEEQPVAETNSDDMKNNPVCSGTDALTYIRSVRDYCLEKGLASGLVLISEIETLITGNIVKEARAKRQSKITEFFD